MSDEIKDIVTAIKNYNIYDYISNNYWKMDKETLKNVLLEYIFLAHEESLDETKVAGEIEERYNLYEEINGKK